MSSGPVEAYLSRLERELRQRGLEDVRILEEAREHLVDAVAEGQHRGLSVDAAEREALERFGAPDVVAAHVVPERSAMMNRLGLVAYRAWHRKWWILWPTVVTAVVTSVCTSYFLPTRYQSEMTVRIRPALVRVNDVSSTAEGRSRAWLELQGEYLLSRARLERIITEFGLYQTARDRASLDDVVRQMRKDITLTLYAPDQTRDGVAGFTVSVVSSDPKTAFRLAERLGVLFVEASLEEKAEQADGTRAFIDWQIEDLRRRIVVSENGLEDLRARNGGRPLSQADLLPDEVLRERYKTLLIAAEESRSTTNLERRQFGEQFRVIEGARVPDQPVGPSRFGVNVVGTLGGLLVSLVLVGVRGA